MEKLLLIALPETAAVERIAAKLHLRCVRVLPEQYTQSIGSLAGYDGVAASCDTMHRYLPETGMLVMCGLNNSRLDKLLALLRNAEISVPHKAVLTSVNKNWSVYRLADELERERQTMR